MSGLDEKGPEWPERLTLRDTKVIADEGQRIFTTATGYGYEKREYVRADLATTAPADVGELVERLREKANKLDDMQGFSAPSGKLEREASTALERITRERDALRARLETVEAETRERCAKVADYAAAESYRNAAAASYRNAHDEGLLRKQAAGIAARIRNLEPRHD